MKKSKPFLIALAGVALATPVQAETVKDWYVSGALGLTVTSDADAESGGSTGDFELDNTVHFAGAVGRHLTENVRGEIELSYRKADLDTVNVDGTGSFDVTGDVKTLGLLANAYYDFMPDKTFSPYVSGGIGLARHDGEITAIAGVPLTGADGDDTVFAYQVGGGASYDVTDNAAVFGGYRYFGSSDPDFSGLDAEYDAHEVRVGVRYGF